MPEEKKKDIRTFTVKNLNCTPVLMLLKEKLQEAGFDVVKMGYGKVTLRLDKCNFSEERLAGVLKKYGMDLIHDREQQLVEEIKSAVYELVHDMNNMNSVIRRSDFIVEKLGYNYTFLSKLFSRHEKTTLEKYIIRKKIERIRELILHDEYTLSEIAHMMGYSSVQYLSNQFREITGESASEYKQRLLSS